MNTEEIRTLNKALAEFTRAQKREDSDEIFINLTDRDCKSIACAFKGSDIVRGGILFPTIWLCVSAGLTKRQVVAISFIFEGKTGSMQIGSQEDINNGAQKIKAEQKDTLVVVTNAISARGVISSFDQKNEELSYFEEKNLTRENFVPWLIMMMASKLREIMDGEFSTQSVNELTLIGNVTDKLKNKLYRTFC